jgi:acyl carrier protein
MKMLEQELCGHICDVCNIKGIECGSIDLNAALIGTESVLGLDSLDAMEIVVMVKNKYNVRIGSAEASRKIMTTLVTLADYIRENQ